MVSSGTHVGAWDYLRWENIRPIEQDGKIVAAKMVVYDGEDEAYITFITQSAYRELADWMKYREDAGENITGDIWVMRDLWDTQVKISRGLVTIQKKLTSNCLKIFTWMVKNLHDHIL
jgi:hypothetical protein